jgi:hypothetical protein
MSARWGSDDDYSNACIRLALSYTLSGVTRDDVLRQQVWDQVDAAGDMTILVDGMGALVIGLLMNGGQASRADVAAALREWLERVGK